MQETRLQQRNLSLFVLVLVSGLILGLVLRRPSFSSDSSPSPPLPRQMTDDMAGQSAPRSLLQHADVSCLEKEEESNESCPPWSLQVFFHFVSFHIIQYSMCEETPRWLGPQLGLPVSCSPAIDIYPNPHWKEDPKEENRKENGLASFWDRFRCLDVHTNTLVGAVGKDTQLPAYKQSLAFIFIYIIDRQTTNWPTSPRRFSSPPPQVAPLPRCPCCPSL